MAKKIFVRCGDCGDIMTCYSIPEITGNMVRLPIACEHCGEKVVLEIVDAEEGEKA